MPIPTNSYSKEILDLIDIYYKAGIWRKYNWYDFLEKLTYIIGKCRKSSSK